MARDKIPGGNKTKSNFWDGTPPARGPQGGVTSAASRGMALTGSANNAIGNRSMNKGGTRPITPGTKAPTHGKFGTVTNKRGR